ncbi:MAG: beta-ketoacyl-ACP synthase II [Clostridium sp.]
MEKRVVITGLGAVTPIGNTVDEFWNGIKEGKLGIDFIKNVETENLQVKIAGEVKNFSAEEFVGKKEVKRLDRFSHFAIAATDEALKQSKLDLEKEDLKRIGVMIGSGIGGFGTIENESKKFFENGGKRISPFFIPMAIINLGAGNVSIKYGFKGPCTSAVTACATGTNNIGDAFRYIKHGYADVMFAGGSEAPITQLGLAGFAALKALNTSNNPERSSIPFDKERCGFVMGEGAGVLVLEELEHALARGANILAEIVGYGSTCDAYHITSPHPDGEGASEAMLDALREGGVCPRDVDYINAHGTSTPYNDKFETLAIKKAFGDHAYNLAISSTKSMVGHLLGAAGAVEAIVCIKSILDSYIPQTRGLIEKDEELDLDYVPNEGREKDVNFAMTNSLGFGGHNATLLFKKYC